MVFLIFGDFSFIRDVYFLSRYESSRIIVVEGVM